MIYYLELLVSSLLHITHTQMLSMLKTLTSVLMTITDLIITSSSVVLRLFTTKREETRSNDSKRQGSKTAINGAGYFWARPNFWVCIAVNDTVYSLLTCFMMSSDLYSR